MGKPYHFPSLPFCNTSQESFSSSRRGHPPSEWHSSCFTARILRRIHVRTNLSWKGLPHLSASLLFLHKFATTLWHSSSMTNSTVRYYDFKSPWISPSPFLSRCNIITLRVAKFMTVGNFYWNIKHWDFGIYGCFLSFSSCCIATQPPSLQWILPSMAFLTCLLFAIAIFMHATNIQMASQNFCGFV